MKIGGILLIGAGLYLYNKYKENNTLPGSSVVIPQSPSFTDYETVPDDVPGGTTTMEQDVYVQDPVTESIDYSHTEVINSGSGTVVGNYVDPQKSQNSIQQSQTNTPKSANVSGHIKSVLF